MNAPLSKSHVKLFFLLWLVTAASTVGARCCLADDKSEEAGAEFFEKSIRPLLIEHCYDCHSAQATKLHAGLLVDSRPGLLRGGDSGAALVPHDANASRLLQAVRYEAFEMPPKGKLPDSQIQLLEQWIEMGAPWPEEAAATGSANGNAHTKTFDLEKRKAEHWAWQPIQSLNLPAISDATWPCSDLDHFIHARLDAAGLRPTRDAERNVLVRRLYFDLIGLPPTPEQVQRFLNDREPNSVERLVDQLLDSPQFGERWGRHWLDLVRYAESRGHEFDNDAPNAYQYRDYVIRALNADVSYDQLIREHIAGDLLESPRLNPANGTNESILGTGFWFLGEWAHSPVDIRKDETDRFDNMIDVMSKTFLAVTVACARCHDHKFDAISTADYYSLCGFLQGSDYRQVPFESIEHNKRVAHQLAELDARYRQQIERIVGSVNSLRLPEPTDASIAVDYSHLQTKDYLQDGFIFGDVPRVAGQPYVDDAGSTPSLKFRPRNAAASDAFWNGLESTSQTPIQNKDALHPIPRSGRTLRTPTFTLASGNVTCRVHGSGYVVACVDSHRLVAGPLHAETIQTIKPDTPWVTLKLDRYIGHRIHLEFTPDLNTQLEVSLVVQGTTPDALKQLEQRERMIETAVQQHSQAWMQLVSKDSIAAGKVNALVQSWAQDRAALKTQVRLQSHVAMAMMDGTPEDDRILIRGSSSNPGNVEPRHFLTAITGGKPMTTPKGSGRLELAEQINDPANPLTSRVIVNRIWHWLMGRGIVPTTDDFGVLGQRPSHPELLDHLAAQFNAGNRSIKRMIRCIVLSRTYQLSSQADPAGLAADAKNLLWHHRPLKRLEGEAIRDALLVISGSLDETMFGEAVPIHLTDFMDGRGRPGTSGPLDGNGRRSIYISVRRNFLSPFMVTFDSPTPFSTMGRRNVSNVPAQALILLNDPFVVQQTSKWAKQVCRTLPLNDGLAGAEDRIGAMYLTAFARRPNHSELEAGLRFVSDQASRRDKRFDDDGIWADFAHALVNTKEFIFLR